MPIRLYREPSQPETLPWLKELLANCASKEDFVVLAMTQTAIAYDKLVSPEQVHIYVQALADLSAPQIAAGFSGAIIKSQFFPSIKELREFAGIPSGRDQALDALAWLAGYIRMYGIDGHTRPTEGHDERRSDGRLHRVITAPEDSAPAIPPTLLRMLSLLGFGDRRKGMELVASHPSVTASDKGDGRDPIWAAKELEARIIYAYGRARLGYGVQEEGRKVLKLPTGS